MQNDELGGTMNNFTFDEIYIGQKESVTKEIKIGDIHIFAGLVDDYSPIHLNKEFGENSPFRKNIAHGFISGSLFSTLVGTKLPGAGALYVSQTLNFKAPVYVGDIITATLEVIEKKEKGSIIMKACAVNQNGILVIDGVTVAKAAQRKFDCSKF